jgi:hypothetical protein
MPKISFTPRPSGGYTKRGVDITCTTYLYNLITLDSAHSGNFFTPPGTILFTAGSTCENILYASLLVFYEGIPIASGILLYCL